MAPAASLVLLPHASGAYGSDDPGVHELEAHGYRQDEYLLSSQVDGTPFTTRLLVRRPDDPAVQSGTIVAEPMHMDGGRPVWGTLHHHLMRGGHAWMEIACQTPPVREHMLTASPERYAGVRLCGGDPERSPVPPGVDPRSQRDTFIAWWWWSSPQLFGVLAESLAALCRGEMEGIRNCRIILMGISQTGGVVRRFARRLASDRQSDAPANSPIAKAPAPDGLLAAGSGGAEPMASPVPTIELLAEADLESVRAGAGLPGQGRALRHRQPDSDRFRLYEVAGMSHMDSRQTTRQPPPGRRWSRFPHSEVMAAVLEQLIAWVTDGVAPPRGLTLATAPGSERLLRDELGHACGGVRTVVTDFPRGRLEPLGDGGRAFPFGCEVPLSAAEVAARYGSLERWTDLAERRAGELVRARWLLPEDAGSW